MVEWGGVELCGVDWGGVEWVGVEGGGVEKDGVVFILFSAYYYLISIHRLIIKTFSYL